MPGISSAKTRFALLPGHDELQTNPRAYVPTATSQACPDMNEAANQGGLRDDRCAGRSERCRTILQHRKLAAFTSDLYKSRDICGSFLRLVRPARPC
jgi:hypothetical protein